jgi:hypothetical protein
MLFGLTPLRHNSPHRQRCIEYIPASVRHLGFNAMIGDRGDPVRIESAAFSEE